MCCFLALSACSGTNDTDEAVAASTDSIIGATAASAYPEAGTLDIDATPNSSWACSAVLIAPKVVLTAGHCVDGHATWLFKIGKESRNSTSAATYDWKGNVGANTVNKTQHDIGLVFLDTAVTLASYPTIANTKLADNATVVNVGRVKDGALTSTLWAAESVVTNGTSTGFPYDYVSSLVVQAGDSGGPDFAKGTHTVVAVNSGAGSTVEVLARTDLVYDWIQSQIKAHADAPQCETEKEPDDTFTNASVLSAKGTCGKLASASDQDFYTVTYGPGSVTVDLATTGDAVFGVGDATGSTCTPTLLGLKSISLTAPAAQKACFRVTGKAQSYTIIRR